MLDLITGDAPNYALTAKQDGAVFNINTSLVVNAKILDKDKNELVASVTCDNSATGADWANSLVVASFTKAQTETVTYTGKGFIELQIDTTTPLTWFYPLNIQLGTI